MTAHKFTFILFLTIATTSLMIPGCCRERDSAATHIQPSGGIKRLSREAPARTRLPRPYGKLKVPAELFVDLIEPESGDAPASIVVSASSLVAARSGVITLRVPEIAGEPGRTEVLWAGAHPGYISEAWEYVLPPLPAGRYHFAAILEFTPDRENAEKLVLSQSLYLDVRADRILSSNVSFKQIERMELYRELEQRVLKTLNPGLAAANPDAMARYRDLIEATNPGLIKSMITELKASDPNVARRIAALNSTKAQAQPASDAKVSSDQGRPARAQAAPVPDSPRD